LDADAQSDAIANVSSFYRGAFLAREQDIPCIVNARDRLAAKFQRLVLRAGKQEETRQDWKAAAHMYRRGWNRTTPMKNFIVV